MAKKCAQKIHCRPQKTLTENDTRVVDFLSRGLRAESYGVIVAHDGLEGLELARTGTDFFTVEVLTLRGLVTYYVLFFIHLESRKLVRLR